MTANVRLLVLASTLLASVALGGPALAGDAPFTEEHVLGSDVSGPSRVIAVDFDGDGDQDVFVANRDRLRWYDNKKNSKEFKERIIEEGTYREYEDADGVDVDGDGVLDVVAVGHQQQAFDKTGGVVWLENVSKGRAWKRHEIDAEAVSIRGMTVGDLDGDGDIVVAVTGYVGLHWYANEGKGASWGKAVLIAEKGTGWDVAAGDLDGDGDVDLALAGMEHEFAWYPSEPKTPEKWGAPKVLKNECKFAREVIAVDADGDGDLDLVGVARTAGLVLYFDNADGKGTFGPDVICDDVKEPGSIAVADMDGDGDLDVVVAPGDYPSELAWLENDDLDFEKRVVASTAKSRDAYIGVAAADLDGDGDTDVVVGSYATGSVRWLENSGKK